MSERLLRLWARRLAPTLSLLATCLGYLLSRHYPVLSEEVLILLVGALVLGAGIGYACERLPEWGVALVSGVLIIISAIFIFNIFNVLSSINNDIPDKSIRYALKFLIVFVLPVGLALLMRRDISLVLSCGMIVFIIGILVDPGREVSVWGSDAPSPEPPRRLVMHIIFDEFTGNSGIEPMFPDGDRLRRDVSTFFVQHGFRLYEGAFSTYPFTYFSLPALFSFAHPIPKDISHYSYAWFKKLHNDGYRVNYIGTELIPICSDPENVANIERCVLYPTMNLKRVHGSHLSPLRKAGEILLLALKNFPYIDKLMTRYKINPVTDYGERLRPGADAQTTLLRGGGDLALVVHILLPHAPMVHDENCALHSNQAFLDGSSLQGAERLTYEHAYAGQVRCALKQLGILLQIVDRRWPNATVIVQGDHGLRLLPFTSNREDVRMRHAALFAVRAKGVAPGVVPQEHNLQMLFAQYAGGRKISDSRLLYGDNQLDQNHALVYPQ